jgi:hypothetical protein
VAGLSRARSTKSQECLLNIASSTTDLGDRNDNPLLDDIEALVGRRSTDWAAVDLKILAPGRDQ